MPETLTLRTPLGYEVVFTHEAGTLSVGGPVASLGPADKNLALVWHTNKLKGV